MGALQTKFGILVLATAWACPDKSSDPEVDTDAAEVDTDTVASDLDATGTWVGGCAGDLQFGGSGSTTTTATEFALQLALVDDAGTLAGTLTNPDATGTTSLTVAGTRSGDTITLGIVGSTTASTSSSSYPAPIEFQLVMSGDTLDGELVYYPDETYGHETFALSCTLAR